jgi:DNA-directed RNA polymerase specialized sigma24 family protein
VKDVAQLLDLPEGTVKSHLHRARRALALMME